MLFSHSLQRGVFNDIRNSPLRRRLPENLQVYDPALEKRLFAKEIKKMPGMGPGRRKAQPSKYAPMAFTDPSKVSKYQFEESPKAEQKELNKDLWDVLQDPEATIEVQRDVLGG